MSPLNLCRGQAHNDLRNDDHVHLHRLQVCKWNKMKYEILHLCITLLSSISIYLHEHPFVILKLHVRELQVTSEQMLASQSTYQPAGDPQVEPADCSSNWKHHSCSFNLGPIPDEGGVQITHRGRK